MWRFARRLRAAAPAAASAGAVRRTVAAVAAGTRAVAAAATAAARGAAAQRHMTTRSAKFPAQPPRPVHPAEVQAARDGASAASAATSASGGSAAVSSSGSGAGSAAADAAGADDTQLKLQSEEIQKLLKVVDLYLAGGKQQRDAVLKALESEGGEDLRAAFLELVPRVIANRAFILDTLATNADVTQQPVVVARLLATDTKHHTPRQVLDGVLAPPVGRSAPVTSDWLQRLSTLDLNTTHDNDAWEFERAFEAVRKSAVASFPELVALHEPAAAGAGADAAAAAAAAADQLSFRVEAAATFVPFVAEKLHALALFGLKSLVVHSELKLAADDPCDSRARAKLHDAFRLPTVADLTEAYGLKADARRELNPSIRRFPTAKVMQTLNALSRTDAKAWHPSNIDQWLPRWDECTAVVREVLRGPARSHEFHKYMSSSFQHDVLTAESMTALSHYVCSRLLAYAPPPQVSAHRNTRTPVSPPQPVTVLEIGAGNGRLTHFLRKHVDKTRRTAPDSVFGAAANPTGARLPPTIKFVATDIAPAKSEVEKVEKLDAAAAVRKYNPQIVICQWMPPGTDLSAAIRRPHDPANAPAAGSSGPAATLPPATPSGVREYVLMGEADSGVCGDAWKTWGATAPDALVWGDGKAAAAAAAAPQPPYAVDGYRRVDLPELTAQQICKNDTFYGIGWSKVVAFRKEQQPTPAAAAAQK